MVWENINIEFKNKVAKIAKHLNINGDDLMKIMASESGINPQATNKTSNGVIQAVGLIQFTKITESIVGATLDELEKMTAVEQLDYVYKYYEGRTNNCKSAVDLYLITFAPSLTHLIGASDESIIYAGDSSAYKYNSALDIDKDGNITVGDLKIHLEKRLENYWNAKPQ